MKALQIIAAALRVSAYSLLLLAIVALAAVSCRPAQEVTTHKTTVTTTTVPVIVKADSAEALIGPVNTPRRDSLDAAALASDLDSTFTGYQRRAVGRAVLKLLETRVKWGSQDTARVDTAGVRVIVYRDKPTGRLRTVILRKEIKIPGKTIIRTDSVQTVRECPQLSPHDQYLLRAGRWLPLPGSGWRGAVTGGILALLVLLLLLRSFLPRR